MTILHAEPAGPNRYRLLNLLGLDPNTHKWTPVGTRQLNTLHPRQPCPEPYLRRTNPVPFVLGGQRHPLQHVQHRHITLSLGLSLHVTEARDLCPPCSHGVVRHPCAATCLRSTPPLTPVCEIQSLVDFSRTLGRWQGQPFLGLGSRQIQISDLGVPSCPGTLHPCLGPADLRPPTPLLLACLRDPLLLLLARLPRV